MERAASTAAPTHASRFNAPASAALADPIDFYFLGIR
jgi:hypothetical protein